MYQWFISRGVVSLTFHEFSKLFSRNLCIAEIVIIMRISSWKFGRVHKAMLWLQSTKLQLEIRTINVNYGTAYFREITLETSRNACVCVCVCVCVGGGGGGEFIILDLMNIGSNHWCFVLSWVSQQGESKGPNLWMCGWWRYFANSSTNHVIVWQAKEVHGYVGGWGFCEHWFQSILMLSFFFCVCVGCVCVCVCVGGGGAYKASWFMNIGSDSTMCPLHVIPCL